MSLLGYLFLVQWLSGLSQSGYEISKSSLVILGSLKQILSSPINLAVDPTIFDHSRRTRFIRQSDVEPLPNKAKSYPIQIPFTTSPVQQSYAHNPTPNSTPVTVQQTQYDPNSRSNAIPPATVPQPQHDPNLRADAIPQTVQQPQYDHNSKADAIPQTVQQPQLEPNSRADAIPPTVPQPQYHPNSRSDAIPPTVTPPQNDRNSRADAIPQTGQQPQHDPNSRADAIPQTVQQPQVDPNSRSDAIPQTVQQPQHDPSSTANVVPPTVQQTQYDPNSIVNAIPATVEKTSYDPHVNVNAITPPPIGPKPPQPPRRRSVARSFAKGRTADAPATGAVPAPAMPPTIIRTAKRRNLLGCSTIRKPGKWKRPYFGVDGLVDTKLKSLRKCNRNIPWIPYPVGPAAAAQGQDQQQPQPQPKPQDPSQPLPKPQEPSQPLPKPEEPPQPAVPPPPAEPEKDGKIRIITKKKKPPKAG